MPKAQAYVEIAVSPNSEIWDMAEANKYKSKSITTGISDSFVQICKKHKIPFEHHEAYRTWLTATQKNPDGENMKPSDLPGNRTKLRPGMQLPKPTGSI